MNVEELAVLTNAKVVSGGNASGKIVKKVFSSDLMSDVLTLDEEQVLLISGLANIQLVRTAEMADIEVMFLARNKNATPEMIQLANEIELIILETPFSIFRASGVLYLNGMKPVY